MRAASTSLLRKNSAIAAVLQTQVVLGLCCCVGFLLLDLSFGKGALAGFASVFVPSSVMAWQQSRTTQAPRMLAQSVVKMVMTAAFMAASFGVWAVNPVSFFITFVITQVSYLVAECIYDAYKAEQHSKALEADSSTIKKQIKIRTLLDDCYPKED